MKWDIDDIEYVLNCINSPDKLNSEEFLGWLEIGEHKKLFNFVLAYREAFLRKEKSETINIDAEYIKFKQRNISRKPLKFLQWSVAAASVVVLFIWLLWNRGDATIGFQVGDGGLSYTGQRMAELVLANGECVELNDNNVNLQELNGTKIIVDTNRNLAYEVDDYNNEKAFELVYNTLRVPAGADYVVRLSDGTKVHLNCDSELRYPVCFDKKERKVFLMGEAYFEVEKSKEWPFVVVTDQMDVRVTGTVFNVQAYPLDAVLAATLVEGGVAVKIKGENEKEECLVPSEQLRLNKITGEIAINNVDVDLYTGWTEGMFVFKNARFEDVMNVLSRWYQVEVFYSDQHKKDLRVSANLNRYDHIDALLQILNAMDKVCLERKGNVVIIK